MLAPVTQSPANVSNEQLLDVSRQMLAFAENGQWDELNHYYENRENLIRAFFSEDVSHQQIEVSACLTEMLSLDGQIKNLLEDNKGQIRDELGRLGVGRNASHAYSTVGTAH